MAPVIALVYLNFTIVAQMASFLILLYILNRVLYKPLLGFLDKRAADIKRSMDEAKDAMDEASQVLDRSRQELEDARKEAHGIKGQAKGIAEREREHIIEAARAEAQQLVGKARKDVESELERTKDDLTRRAGVLAVDIAERLLRSELTDEQKQLATTTYVSEIESMPSGE